MNQSQNKQLQTSPNNQKLKSKNYLFGFTLVELIVVIVILAILATIAFLSFNSQSSAARNSTRMADINNVSKSLELYFIKAGSYPSPDNNLTITYLGGDLWYQGTIGDSLTKRLQSLSKKVIDPLNNTEYNYSKIAYGSAYQIKANFEGDVSVYNNNRELFDNTYAATGTTNMTTYLKGNYYSAVAKTFTGGLIYLVATPSISSTVTSNSEITSNALSGKILLSGRTTTTELTFNPKPVFSGATLPKDDTSSGITNMMTNIANAYAGTEVATILPNVKEIVNTPTTELATLGSSMISTQLGSSASAPISTTNNNTGTVSNSCASNPSFSNLGTLTTGTPTSVGQAWTYSTTPGNCTYSCVNGYSGSSCATLPAWTVAGGGDCLGVTNILGSNGNTGSCVDNRTYSFQDGATHDRTYNLLKIDGKWYFNENLAYTPTTGYKGSGTWSTSDVGYYSCPGDTGTSSNCNAVSTIGFLYQWSSAMLGNSSTNNTGSRVQGLCPNGWAIPTKLDFTSISNSFWPTNDNSWAGNTSGWTNNFIGQRTNTSGGTFSYSGTHSYIWSSTENDSTTSWGMHFSTLYPTGVNRFTLNKGVGFSIRCIKN